ncbi:eotaxin-like [Boleophthalmus pectinirostris]|uniref:eotaxin-like n=1 Tax=Boleophthalmus pectinirostris TaxID=150288 RepID=UPI000A1C331A|nr:eotaxin-like [Boleophthalmus pectinirostris]
MARRMIVLLIFVATFVVVITAQSRMQKCCRYISKTQPHPNRLKRYYKQTRTVCPLHVVVFVTLKDKRICANPKSDWTKTTMKHLDNKTVKYRKGSRLRDYYKL